MPVYPHRQRWPQCGERVFLASNAVVTGDVHLGDDVSLWFGVVARGDVEEIRVGAGSNVQDGAILHTSRDFPLHIGENVVIGHSAVVHGCRLEDGCLIGIGARVLDGAVVESGAQLGAGAVLAPGKVVPAGHLALGVPARVARPLRDEERQAILDNAARYVALKEEYRVALQEEYRQAQGAGTEFSIRHQQSP
ncbi:MAG: gamma carbonic anhydrase family protein [Acidobacteriota bacterium]